MRFSFLFFFFLSTSVAQKQSSKIYYNSSSDSSLFVSRMNKALNFFKNKELDSFKKYSKQSLHLTTDLQNIQKVHFYLATFYKYRQIPDSAYYHYNQSKSILLQIGDTITAGKRMSNIAQIQWKQNELLASEISSITALEYIEKANLNIVKHNIYNYLGLVFIEKKNLEEALRYYDFSFKELEKDSNSNTSLKLDVINNKGLLYQRFNNHKKAIQYFKEGLSYDSISIKYPKQYSLLLENLTSSNFLLGKTDNSINQYNKVLTIKEEIGDFSGLSTTHINISDYYKKFNNKEKALHHAEEALKYAQQSHNNKRWLESLQLLSNLTKGQASKNYLNQYIILNDSLIQKERQQRNQFARIRYETEKKEKENTLLKTENEQKKAEIAYQKQQKTIAILFGLISLLVLGVSILYFILRRRKLIYQAQIQKAEVREKERQQIAKSLHDEVAGDLRLLHQKLAKTNLFEEAKKIESVKDNVRNLSHQLSSISFDKVSFKDQIINLVSDYFSTDFKIKIQGLKEHDWSTIDGSIKRLLYLGVRESIQNCLKYAQASKIDINFSIHKKTVFLNIADNGIGFNTKAIKKGIGLLNLEERVEELNGFMVIESEVGKGTQTKIQIPLNAQNNKNLIS